MCDIAEMERLNAIVEQESSQRKTPENLSRYLAAYRDWVRRGEQGRPPESLNYGLMCYDVIHELGELRVEFAAPTGLGHWNFYSPDYYRPMMEIRQIADRLGLDPDAAAAEFHAASPEQPWKDSPLRHAILEDYRHAIFEHCQRTGSKPYRFLLAGYEGKAAKAAARRPTPTLFNPYKKTGASALLSQFDSEGVLACTATL